MDFLDLLLAPASKVLDNWFEGDVLKATLETDAVIGATKSVTTPSGGYVLLHHVMGETDGHRGVWSYIEGGMRSVLLAISKPVEEAGAHILPSTKVSKKKLNAAVFRSYLIGKSAGGNKVLGGQERFQSGYVGSYSRRLRDSEASGDANYLKDLYRRNDPEAVIRLFESQPSLHSNSAALSEYITALVKVDRLDESELLRTLQKGGY